MQTEKLYGIVVESRSLLSVFLGREVKIDFYIPKNVTDPAGMSLLLINDGQNMKEMGLIRILENLYAGNAITPLLCVAIHTGSQRKMEYGVASQQDYLGRGANAGFYTSFVLRELLPFIRDTYKIASFKERAFAGLSLGALMALDIVFNHPEKFSKAGLFSGSFWWRSVDQTEKHYDDDMHRIIHQEIRSGNYYPGMKFFFQCGNMDEKMDRNNNGIIDSIDDTLDVIKELVAKGYNREKDITYLEMEDGKHDIATWARAMPEFLKWGWERKAD
jgi:enterochelin esterase-like enzyme